MRLKSLELSGFKSFADRTEFVFDQDVTVVVGPNGCGKSNLVDAVKWVLGEQSARSLRGSEMADLIFNGNGDRGSMGYAEASLVLHAPKSNLPVDSDEVVVTRRLYRSGESEYLLNKQICRLKDIRELFMDTGIGVEWYSVVEQGRVDALVSAKPEERRRIFEEAAGISRYKAKRKEAIARLERVEQNLARVSDIISEVQRQLHSVKVQAGRARSYRECSEQLRALRTRLALHEYDALGRARAEIARAMEESERQRESSRERVAGLRETIAGLEAEAVLATKRISDAEAKVMVLESQRKAQSEKIEINQKRIEELGESMREQMRLAAEFEDRRQDACSRLEEEKTALAECEREVASARALIEESSRRLESLRAEVEGLRRQAEKDKETLFELAQQKSRLQNDMSNVMAELRVLEARDRRLEDRRKTIAAELASLDQKRGVLAAERDSIAGDISATGEALAGKSEARGELEREIAALEEERSRSREELTALTSRESLLSDMERRLEGFQAGVKALLEEAGRPGTDLGGIVGVLGLLFDVDVKLAAAAEAVLGERAQLVVTETVAQARNAISFIKSRNLGPVSFLPLEFVQGDSLGATDPGSLLSFLSCSERVRPALARLIGEATIVDDLEEGLRLRAGNNPRRYVTLAGDLVEPPGIVRSGGTGGTGIVTRRSELKSLREQITAARANIERLLGIADQKKMARTRVAREEEELRSRIQQLQTALNERTGQIAAVELSGHDLGEEKGVVQSELEELRHTVEEASACRERQAREMAELEERRQAVEAEVRQLEAKRDEDERVIAEVAESETQGKLRLATWQEKASGLERSVSELEVRAADYARAAGEATEKARGCEGRRAGLGEEIKKAEELAERMAAEAKQRELEAQASREACDALQTDIAGKRTELGEAESALDALEAKSQDLRVRHKERDLEMSSLAARIREDYQEDLARLHEGYREESADWDAVRAEVTSLEERLRRIGSVNLDAIREQEELESRESFLTLQREDLTRARETTLNTIRRLNARSRELFRETLEQIRANFQETFRKLFGGGRADILVDETVDILEADIEISVRPPGKTACSLSLLSGGEKALVGVALLFAVLKAKACPFCFLDEVDAALDETNIDKFSNLLRELAGASQFIVVTHSRRTMGVADLLYGITMQESGVSKKVSVKFRRTEEGQESPVLEAAEEAGAQVNSES